MRHLDKRLAIAATATALLGAIGASVAQSTEPDETDSTVQKVEVNGSGQQIYFFRDQGNSPETDPAAHLMLIKHEAVPVAETTTSTTVAESTTTSNDAVTTTMPAPSDTSNTETGTGASSSTAAAPVDNTPALAPKADRN
jgi:hypothetical protein